MSAGWHEANQRYLMAALGVLRCLLERDKGERTAEARRTLDEAEAAMPAPPALDALAAALRLSPFERGVVLLCAGVELDSAFAACCASAQGDPRRILPTFSLALAVLPDAHWSALGPAGPLRRFRLIEVGAGDALTQSPLRIDERVLHYLAGVHHPDERLASVLEPAGPTVDLVPSHRRIADQITAVWSRAMGPGPLPIVEMCGGERASKRAIAAAACTALGLRLDVISAGALGAGLDEIAFSRLLTREAILGGSAVFVDGDDLEGVDATRSAIVRRIVERSSGPILVATRERMDLLNRSAIVFDVRRPTVAEQRALWRAALVEAASCRPDAPAPDVEAIIEPLVAQFDLSAPVIRSAGAAVAAGAGRAPEEDRDLGRAVWDACRAHARPRLDDLAQRVEASAAWDDLVLPAPQREALREIAIHVLQRSKVYGAWGFAKKDARGLGISALFSGASGTGKTMAAEVLANELRLDLYRIDLSQVVSKYIGETEKNLRRVFDAAEEGAAILLFDEADALFGKRSEVKDSHDRYANIEVGYLLQRMEAYRGLAILTTNLKSALDPAFLRRIRFVVQFPFPDTAQRAEIWRRVFPRETPTEGLDAERLARMNVAGGSIRNIAMNAAFLAAEDGGPVRMAHVMRAAREEFGKLERPMTVGEVDG